MTPGRLLRLARRGMERTLRFGPDDLRRTAPLHPAFGYHRGTPVDRVYIDGFLARESALVHGDGLEVAEDRYLSRIGGGRLASVTTLHLDGPAPGRLVGDLTRAETLPEGRFDCFICTQTLNFLYDVPAAVRGCARLLKPGGHLLLTVAGTMHRSRYDAERWGDFWRFTPQSVSRMLAEAFTGEIRVAPFGNVLAATAMLHGIVAEELTPEELAVPDPDYPVVICAVARKAAGESATSTPR